MPRKFFPVIGYHFCEEGQRISFVSRVNPHHTYVVLGSQLLRALSQKALRCRDKSWKETELRHANLLTAGKEVVLTQKSEDIDHIKLLSSRRCGKVMSTILGVIVK